MATREFGQITEQMFSFRSPPGEVKDECDKGSQGTGLNVRVVYR